MQLTKRTFFKNLLGASLIFVVPYMLTRVRSTFYLSQSKLAIFWSYDEDIKKNRDLSESCGNCYYFSAIRTSSPSSLGNCSVIPGAIVKTYGLCSFYKSIN